MDTSIAMMMGEVNRGREMMVFDWDKAAQIIKDENVIEASAGLIEDWEWTGGAIFENGNPVIDEYTYLASTWATPTLEIKVENGVESFPCYKMQSEVPDWNSGTKWPESALNILNSSQLEE